MKTTLTPQMLAPILESIAGANAAHERLFPGDPVERQPVHTVYGGAHLFTTETATKFGSIALDMLRKFAPDSAALEKCVGSPLPSAVYERVLAKLEREPVEDYRIDFADGYSD